jgi:hypothetical protein
MHIGPLPEFPGSGRLESNRRTRKTDTLELHLNLLCASIHERRKGISARSRLSRK